MSELADVSVDLIITSPPYNIGTKYADNLDRLSLGAYQGLLRRVFAECFRVLKEDGKIIIEVADSVIADGVCIQLAGYLQSVCVSLGLKLEERRINFVNTKGGFELPDHNWNADYVTKADAHSNCHQILVLSKSKNTEFNPDGKVVYFNYSPADGHPCPIPDSMRSFLLDAYFKKGFTVLDCFMGTGSLGSEVIKRGGEYVGYELAEKHFNAAEKRLKEII